MPVPRRERYSSASRQRLAFRDAQSEGALSRQQLRCARRCESMPRLRIVWPQRRDRPNTKRQTAGACASSVRQGSHEAREGVPSNSDGAWERRANRVRGPIALRVSPNCVCVPWRMLEAQWENRARSRESRGRARRFSVLSSDTWARRDRDLALEGWIGRSEVRVEGRDSDWTWRRAYLQAM